jgi:hypothetical protein
MSILIRFCLRKGSRFMKKFCKKLVLFLTMYILLGLSSMIAIQCSLICLPVSMIIGGVGLFLIEYYVEHYDRFNDNKA